MKKPNPQPRDSDPINNFKGWSENHHGEFVDQNGNTSSGWYGSLKVNADRVSDRPPANRCLRHLYGKK